jgi:phenylalanine-4-hydroxylase
MLTDTTASTSTPPPGLPPPGVAADWTIPQHWDRFTAEEHRVWDLLFRRQRGLLADRAVTAFLEGLEILNLSRPGIPDLDELNERLFARTGWTVVSVPGLVPDDIFFGHLSCRRFPAGNFIRRADQLDYLEEPDVFHDLFGHVPLLARPAVADFMQALGEAGLRALRLGEMDRLSRLYWYTVEFGLAGEDGRPKIYGAGLLSSFGEARFALDGRAARHFSFEVQRILRTRYRSDAFQHCYFVIDGFEALLDSVLRAPLEPLYAGLTGVPDIDPSAPEWAAA